MSHGTFFTGEAIKWVSSIIFKVDRHTYILILTTDTNETSGLALTFLFLFFPSECGDAGIQGGKDARG